MTETEKLVQAIKMLLGIMQDFRYGRTTYDEFCIEYDKIENEMLQTQVKGGQN